MGELGIVDTSRCKLAIASWSAPVLRRFRASHGLRKAPEGWSSPKRFRDVRSSHGFNVALCLAKLSRLLMFWMT
jgi:hypothetical protein